MMPEERQTIVEARLTEAFQPSHLVVIDESAQHRGHAGARTGMSHFALEIAADSLEGKSRIQAHRMIYDCLGDLINTEIHALKIKLL